MTDQPIADQISRIRAMGEPQDDAADIIPTLAEKKLIARLRQLSCMVIIDADSMTLWAAPRPEFCNGKRPK